MISERGYGHVHWTEQDAPTGDAEALTEVREAERIFARERARGATAYRLEVGKPIERMEQFHPQAAQIIMVAVVVGG